MRKDDSDGVEMRSRQQDELNGDVRGYDDKVAALAQDTLQVPYHGCRRGTPFFRSSKWLGRADVSCIGLVL